MRPYAISYSTDTDLVLIGHMQGSRRKPEIDRVLLFEEAQRSMHYGGSSDSNYHTPGETCMHAMCATYGLATLLYDHFFYFQLST
jgi:hypothetical protein